MRELLRTLRAQQPHMLRLLRRLVQTESPSLEKTAVDRLGRLLATEWRRRGAQVRTLRQRQRGDHLRVSVWLGHGRPAGQLLVLGHLDTVYPPGTLRQTPFRITGGRVYGPGVYDMKAGLVMALFAVDALRQLHIAPQKRLVFLFTSDEEIGSDSSRRWIEAEARRSDAVLVLEPSAGRDGRLKTARKGVGHWTVTAHGRAAHAGINPQDGVNAIHELAWQIARIARFQQPRRGVTVNVDVIAGGTRANVIAERATAEVDVRVWRMADAKRLAQKFRALRPVLRGARLEIRGGMNRPPLERTRAVRHLFRHAQQLAQQMGLELKEAATGGGSDGNLTAALGVPTLDGLGAVGDGAHSPREFVYARSLPERAALLAGLLATL